jgi:hypothetical protein
MFYVLANTAATIFMVNDCWGPYKDLAVGVKWEVTDVTGQTEEQCVIQCLTTKQLYLEKCHIMMLADLVHATLEQYFKPPSNSLPGSVTRICQMWLRDAYNVKIIDFQEL